MNAITLNEGNTLTKLEWQVVAMARSDGPRSMNPDGRFTRFLREFFGVPVTRKLANERLETLRRFCVRAWYWDVIRAKDLQQFIGAGYSSSALFQILAHVAGYRGFTPSIEEQFA
jgi:hypothetical protein